MTLIFPYIPACLVPIFQSIQQEGEKVYLVGGALRDIMLEKAPTDFDMATTLTSEQLLKLFPQAKQTGGAYGTVQILLQNNHYCEITPCRTESEYIDYRHPSNVQFTKNILQDLLRRDFTINAMAFDGEVLVDLFGGQEDIENKRICCVGLPLERFSEDPLRILRLIRFQATLGFMPEWATFYAAMKKAYLIEKLKTECIKEELEKILLAPFPTALEPFISKGAFCFLGINSTKNLGFLSLVPNNLLCRWWAFSELCQIDIEHLNKIFCFSKKFMYQLRECNRFYKMGASTNRIDLKFKIKNTRINCKDIIKTFAILNNTFLNDYLYYQQICKKQEPYCLQQLCINGKHLNEIGIQGKDCGIILNRLLDVIIYKPELNRACFLLELAKGMYRRTLQRKKDYASQILL